MADIAQMLTYALQGASGAVAGYITNKYAVNMLFKEYGPFKLGGRVLLPFRFGGVIKNRKEQFVDEISSLVERDIINGSTLKDSLGSEKVKNEIISIFNTFLNEALIQAFDGKRLNDIAGFDSTIQNLKILTFESCDEVLNPILQKISDSIDLNQLLSEGQINELSDILFKLVCDGIENRKSINYTITALHNESSEIKLSNFINESAFSSVKANISKMISSALDEFFEGEGNLTSLIDEVINIMKIDELIDTLQSKLKEKTIEDFISDDEIDSLSINISRTLESYINSEDGISLVNSVVKEFITILKNIDFSVYDLMNDEIGQKLTSFINEKLPVFLPYVSSWIESNKDEFDKIIEESIDEGIENMDAGIRRMILSLVREYFLDDISTKHKVIQRVVDFIESYRMDSSEADKLAAAILKYLKDTKIKDIIISLEKSNILTDDIINNISTFIIGELSERSNNVISQLIRLQKSKSIGDLITYDFKEILNSRVIERINTLIIEEKDKIKSFAIEGVLNKVHSEMSNLMDKNIKSLISEATVDNIMKNSTPFIGSVLTNNESSIKEYITESISGFINNIDVKRLTEDNSEIIHKYLRDKVISFEEDIFEKGRVVKISDIIRSFVNNDKMIDDIGKEAALYLEDNLEELLKGRIKIIVYDNLIQLDEDEICNLAQKFMGTELQPLSIFGGVLGLIGGLIFGLFSKNVGLLGSYNSIYQLIGSIVLMGGIGVATNIIAIAMLFKPYKKNKLLSKIPFLKNFALGYIPAHKGDLADGIGSVIDNEILNGVKIQELFEGNKEVMHAELMNLIASSNYKFLSDSIIKNKISICRYLHDKIVSTIKIKDEAISGSLVNQLSSLKVESVVDKNTLSRNVAEKIASNKEMIKRYILNFLERNMKSDEKISEIIPSEVMGRIGESIQSSLESTIRDNSVEMLSKEFVRSSMLKLNGTYNDVINKKLQAIINDDTFLRLKEQFVANMEKFLYDDLRYILGCKAKEILTVELDGEKTVESIFNGSVKKAVDNNLNKISLFIINKLTDMVVGKESYISDIVKLNINSRLNFIQKMGYAMAGGDRIVDNCVTIAVNKKLPIFINDKMSEVEAIIEESLNKAVYPMKISDFNLGVNEINSSQFIYNIFESMANNKSLDNIINSVNDEIMNNIRSASLISILRSVNLDNTEKIYSKFEEEIEYGRNELIHHIVKQTSNLADYGKNLIVSELKEVLINNHVKDLFINVNDKDIEYAAKEAVSTVLSSKSLRSGIISVIDEIYDNSLMDKYVGSFILCDLLKNDLTDFINNLIDDESMRDTLFFTIDEIVIRLLKNNLEVLDMDMKDDINNIVSDAILNVLILHTKSILESLELKEITYREIEKMDPKEIHELFDSFAGEYFKKLYGYGAIGAVFGINLWIPIVWAVIEYARGKAKAS